MKKDKIRYIKLNSSLDYSRGDKLCVPPLCIYDYLMGETTISREDSYGRHIKFDILGYDETLKDSSIIGYLYGRFFDYRQMLADEFDPEEVFHTVDQYTWEMYESIRDHETAIGLKKNIFMIDSIFIEKEYRNTGIGSVAIIMLEEMMKADFGREIGVFVTDSAPRWGMDETEPGEEEYEKMEQNVLKFWSKLGFQPVKGDYRHKYMFFNTNFDMRKIYNRD